MICNTSFSSRHLGASIALIAACSANLVTPSANAAVLGPHISLAATALVLRHADVAAEIPSGVTSAKFLGRLAPLKRIAFSVVLPLQHRADLDALIKVQNDRQSPQFRHWLPRGQFARRFGADPKAVATIETALVADGAKIEHINESKTVIEASAPVETVEKVFATKIGTFAASGRQSYANMTPAHHPAEFRGAELGVLGLDNFPHMKTFNTGFNVKHLPSTTLRSGKIGTNYASGAEGGYTAKDLSIAYDFPWKHYGNNTAGSGVTMGIVMVGDYLDSDIKMYREKNVDGNHPPKGSLTRVPVDGGGAFDPTESIEVTLDVEQSTSLAPRANELVYEVPDLSNQSIVDAYDAVVTDNTADVVNSSFGGCEQFSPFDVAVDQAFAQGIAQGQTFFASSGDQGSACYPNYTYGVSMPASDPYSVAVGGTRLATGVGDEYGGEFAWDGSGGGISGEWGFPSYQQYFNITDLAQQTLFISTTLRNVPDISLNADYLNSPDEISFNGAEGTAGGTSFASPDATAAFAIIDGHVGRVGLANAGIYFLASLLPFHDVANGCNGLYTFGNCAAYGYDLVTGWGSFDADVLLQEYEGVLGY